MTKHFAQPNQEIPAEQQAGAGNVPHARVGSPSKTDRFMTRLREYLTWELHTDAERYDFLLGQSALWEDRYADFIQLVDAGNPPKGQTAFDYVETIAAIETERAKYSPFKETMEKLNQSAAEMKQRVESMKEALS